MISPYRQAWFVSYLAIQGSHFFFLGSSKWFQAPDGHSMIRYQPDMPAQKYHAAKEKDSANNIVNDDFLLLKCIFIKVKNMFIHECIAHKKSYQLRWNNTHLRFHETNPFNSWQALHLKIVGKAGGSYCCPVLPMVNPTLAMKQKKYNFMYCRMVMVTSKTA